MTNNSPKLAPRNYPYEVIVPPAVYPIELAELKIQTKIDWDDPVHDTWLTEFIIAPVVQCAENYTRLAFITRTIKTFRDCFYYFIELKKAPFLSLTTFKYLNLEDVLDDVPAESYYSLKRSPYGNILLSPNNEYPNDLTEKFAGIEIVFDAGYGPTKEDVPSDLKLAMLQHATFFYQNRGDCCDAEKCCPPAAKAIYEKNRVFDLSGYQYYD